MEIYAVHNYIYDLDEKNLQFTIIIMNNNAISRKEKKETIVKDVIEDWGTYMAAKKAKLEDQFQRAAENEFQDATSLFRGIAIFVNGYTHPCADVLKRLMMEHGGIYHHYLRSNATTHLIASNLPYSKIVQYRKSKNPLPLCKPEWITDSIKANKLLDWRTYLLYSSTSVTQPQLEFENEKKTEKPFDDSNPNSKKIPRGKIDEGLIKPKTGAALCSKNEEFLSEFYNNSRLHHIATMGATFKEYINELRSECNKSYPGLERLKNLKRTTKVNCLPIDNNSDSDEDSFEPNLEYNRGKICQPIIMHIDMDCFFVSVGLKSRPELKGQPVAVTHAKGNKRIDCDKEDSEEFGSMAEIASCSYEARKSGIKNGMFLGQALKLCPNLKTIKYDFEGYKEVSYTLYNTVASYTLQIEAVSCDEMYADISSILKEVNLAPLEFANIIRSEIKEKTGCPVSTGFGRNKLQARLATKRAKPDGQYHLKTEDVASYIDDMSVRDIPGVGWSTMKQLRKMNVEVCKDMKNITLATLQKEFGKKTGEMLFNTCRGIDHSKLNIEHVRKSVSAEVNYGIRFENNDDARNFLTKLSKEVCARLIKINAKGRSITLKLMVRAKNAPKDPTKFMGHGLCDNFTKSKNNITPVNDETIIIKDVLLLWEQMQQPATDIRGIGIQISRLDNTKSNTVNTTNLMKFIAKNKPQNENNTEKDARFIRNFNTTDSTICEETKKINSIVHNSGNEMKIEETIPSELSGDMKMKVLKLHKENLQQEAAVNNRGPAKQTSSSLSQGVDEDVLAELPEDIRNEILASKPTLKKSQPNAINNYFKHKKPGTCSKSKMPSIQELDVKVLIELPDDIRNEILNEYRMDKSQLLNRNYLSNEPSSRQTSSIIVGNSRKNGNDSKAMNCSFSEIDPEFLAALDNETRDDVRNYCLAKKNEKELKLKEKMNDKIPASIQVKSKTRGEKPKSLSAKKTSLGSLQKKCNNEKNHDMEAPVKNLSFLQNEMSILQHSDDLANNYRNKDIKLLNSMFYDNNVRSNEHQNMLSTLVHYLCSLPLQQVKRQIQTWIYESDNVNEIDLLSITKYLSMLPKEKRIDDLHILMKTMHRCMTETGSCIWHETYRKTVEYVQQYMQIEYNSNLMLPEIICNLQDCKNDRV